MTRNNRKPSAWVIRMIAVTAAAAVVVVFCKFGLAAWNNYLPDTYDLRRHNRAATVEDQGYLGTCWAFASLMALESSLLPEEDYHFSEDHMSNNPNFKLGQNEGGEYTMSMAYLLSWQGPVLESDDPYGDGCSPEGLSAVRHVQEIHLFASKDYNSIKRAVRLTGGVESSLYITRESRMSSEDAIKLKNYCYTGENRPNHDIVIVGWDDHYPKENFEGAAKNDGAFICENSWGSSFGDGGFFYVSYEDTNIGKYGISFVEVDKPDNYDKIYQSDLCGWTAQIGYGCDTVWAANVYETDTPERLAAVGFYAIVPDTKYEVYVVMDPSDLTKQEKVAEGSVSQTGYYTVRINRDIILDAHSRFGVMIRLVSPGSTQPIAIEYDAGDGKCNIDLSDGEGYLSADGIKWERIEKTQNCNLCLKAYTNQVK